MRAVSCLLLFAAAARAQDMLSFNATGPSILGLGCKGLADCGEGEQCANLLSDDSSGSCVAPSNLCACGATGSKTTCVEVFSVLGMKSVSCQELCDHSECNGECATEEACVRRCSIPILAPEPRCVCSPRSEGCSKAACAADEVCVKPGYCAKTIQPAVV
eukprot:GDKI01031462.1.p1 GENE.GDKI01031462.1~~GDKI01031462.1.p1  ORF type:complete len:160 (-),score=36.64 GDKI01031462.1:414-893(-)